VLVGRDLLGGGPATRLRAEVVKGDEVDSETVDQSMVFDRLLPGLLQRGEQGATCAGLWADVRHDDGEGLVQDDLAGRHGSGRSRERNGLRWRSGRRDSRHLSEDDRRLEYDFGSGLELGERTSQQTPHHRRCREKRYSRASLATALHQISLRSKHHSELTVDLRSPGTDRNRRRQTERRRWLA